MNGRLRSKIQSMFIRTRYREQVVLAAIMLVNSLILLILREHVYEYLPSICGIVLMIRGIVQFLVGVEHKDYLHIEQNEIGMGLISLAMGIGIMQRQDHALFVIGVFWGMFGLRKSMQKLNVFMYKVYNSEIGRLARCLLIVEIAFGFIVSFLIIFDPYTNTRHHIVLLGVEMLYEGVIQLLHLCTRWGRKYLL